MTLIKTCLNCGILIDLDALYTTDDKLIMDKNKIGYYFKSHSYSYFNCPVCKSRQEVE